MWEDLSQQEGTELTKESCALGIVILADSLDRCDAELYALEFADG